LPPAYPDPDNVLDITEYRERHGNE